MNPVQKVLTMAEGLPLWNILSFGTVEPNDYANFCRVNKVWNYTAKLLEPPVIWKTRNFTQYQNPDAVVALLKELLEELKKMTFSTFGGPSREMSPLAIPKEVSGYYFSEFSSFIIRACVSTALPHTMRSRLRITITKHLEDLAESTITSIRQILYTIDHFSTDDDLDNAWNKLRQEWLCWDQQMRRVTGVAIHLDLRTYLRIQPRLETVAKMDFEYWLRRGIITLQIRPSSLNLLLGYLVRTFQIKKKRKGFDGTAIEDLAIKYRLSFGRELLFALRKIQPHLSSVFLSLGEEHAELKTTFVDTIDLFSRAKMIVRHFVESHY